MYEYKVGRDYCGLLCRAGLWPLGRRRGRGPTGDGKTVEDPWSNSGSLHEEIAWQVDVGAGFSSVAVAFGKVYTLGNIRGTDTVYCLEVKNGKVLWQTAYPQHDRGALLHQIKSIVVCMREVLSGAFPRECNAGNLRVTRDDFPIDVRCIKIVRMVGDASVPR